MYGATTFSTNGEMRDPNSDAQQSTTRASSAGAPIAVAPRVHDRTFDQYLGYQGHPEDIYNRTVRNGNPNALAIGVTSFCDTGPAI